MSCDYILFRPNVATASHKDIYEHILSNLGATDTVMSWLSAAFPSILWETTTV